jgi:hypothetical protein
MGPSPPAETYRLIVVYDDGVRVVGLSGVSKTTAEEFRARMLEFTGFTTVLVEAESDRPSGHTAAARP